MHRKRHQVVQVFPRVSGLDLLLQAFLKVATEVIKVRCNSDASNKTC